MARVERVRTVKSSRCGLRHLASVAPLAIASVALSACSSRGDRAVGAPEPSAALERDAGGGFAESAGAAERIAELRARFAIGAGVATAFEPANAHVRAVFPRGAKRAVLRSATALLPARANGPIELEDDSTHVAVKVSLRGASDAPVQIAHGFALYRGALRGSDVVHRVHAEGTEDYVVFERRPANEEIAYDVDVSRVAGLRLVSNVLELLDEAGAPRLRVAPPWVMDASGTLHEAKIAVDGCAYDRDPSGPWGRPVTRAGAERCGVRVTWEPVAYPAIVDPSWVATGSMATPRKSHTATLLGSGKVLVAGGQNLATVLSSAELFDGTSFAATGSMTSPRQSHTATLLASGKVLVAGGSNGGGLSTAELFDGTSTFAATGSLHATRENHTATLLGSGKVLIAGGDTGSGGMIPLSSAELFDGTSSFAVTGSMTTTRLRHTATLLASGKVLIAGGGGLDAGTPTTAELFDGTSAFAATGSMTRGRIGHSATRLGSGAVLVAGGYDQGVETSTAELFDGTSSFAATGSMSAARYFHTATLLVSGSVLVAGGEAGTTSLSTAEIFDGTSLFSAAPSMNAARAWHTATLLPSGGVLIAGGSASYSGAASATAEVYTLVAPGGACATSQECASGICVDGVCCTDECTGLCRRCAVGTGTCSPVTSADDPDTCTGSKTCDASGACKRKDAQACSSDGDCASGHCADGVCCDTPCSGTCRACTAAKKGSGSDGTCGDVAAETDPDDECPEALPSQCAPGGVCNGGGACKPYVPQGTACGLTACVGGVQTGPSCDGVGHCGSNAVTCAPYACGVTACNTSCTTSADCASTAYCDPSGHCTTLKTKGDPCSTEAECSTTFCVDGICCENGCTGQCAACDVAGSVGTCSPVTGTPHGTRAPCTGAGEECGGTCDGANQGTCQYPAASTACGTPSCANGSESASRCDGQGACAAPVETLCAPYTCGAKACETSCASDADCSGGNECKPDHTCAPRPGASCKDDHTVVDGSGTATPCDPYTCIGGACKQACSSVDDCVSGYVCDATKTCTSAAAAAGASDSGGCGCRAPGRGAASDGVGWGLLLAALVGSAARSRRRRACRSRRRIRGTSRAPR